MGTCSWGTGLTQQAEELERQKPPDEGIDAVAVGRWLQEVTASSGRQRVKIPQPQRGNDAPMISDTEHEQAPAAPLRQPLQ